LVGNDDQINSGVGGVFVSDLGLQALNQQHSLRLVSTNHEGRWNPKYDYRVMKPGYMWITAIYDDGETVIEGFDGQRGWEKWGEKPAEYVSGDAARGLNQGAQSPVHLYGLNHMEQLGARVTFDAGNWMASTSTSSRWFLALELISTTSSTRKIFNWREVVPKGPCTQLRIQRRSLLKSAGTTSDSSMAFYTHLHLANGTLNQVKGSIGWKFIRLNKSN
jgi:hypothetical protein